MKKKRKKFFLILFFSLFLLLTEGCSNGQKIELMFSMDFRGDEVFRIDKISCRLPEIMVYLTNIQNKYEEVYGSQIWEQDLGGISIGDRLKEMMIARAAQIKVMVLLAREKDLALNEEEERLASKAGDVYFGSLNEEEIKKMGVNKGLLVQMYKEYALANKVYKELTKEINPEISDDEARTISVKHILIKTYTLDENGQKVEYTEEQKEKAYEKIKEVKRKADSGTEFEELMEEYNEDKKGSYAFGKGTMDPTFEEAAFNLDRGEISEIVTTPYGYHLIQCTSTFDRNETDANKVKIVEERRKEAFSEEYDAFASELATNLNEKLWASITMTSTENVGTMDFFDVYDEIFGP